MRNEDRWVPSKFVYHRGKLAASRDPGEVAIGSRLMVELIARSYDRHIREHVRGRLIDLGSGKVPLYQAYKNRVTEAVCVDWANTKHKSQHLDFECDLTRELPFRDGEFDSIILSDVLEHIPEPERLWKEMSRILAPRGRILLNVPFYYWIHEEPHDYYRYTEFALRRLAESSGVSVLVLEPIGGVPEILADVLAKNLLHLPALGRFLSTLVQRMTLGLVATQWGRRASKSTARKFPLGYFLVAEKPL